MICTDLYTGPPSYNVLMVAKPPQLILQILHQEARVNFRPLRQFKTGVRRNIPTT